MLIRMRTLAASAAGVRRPGDVIEVSVDEGMALVAGGYAEALSAPATERREQAVKPPRTTRAREVKHP